MSGVSKAISDELFLLAQSSLKKLGKVGQVSRKLQAIIAAKKIGISMASEVFNTSRQSLMTWIKNLEEDAENGLKLKSGRGRKPIANVEINNFAAQFMQKNPNTTNAELRQIIKEKHNVNMSETTVNRLAKNLGLSYITPRPIHYKANLLAQEEFKKNSKQLPKNHRKKSSCSLTKQDLAHTGS